MTSGGARARSGPAPDPNALRRGRKDDAGWVSLPADGFDGVKPVFPLSAASAAELDLWDELWLKPQADQWAVLGLERQVAAYVRSYLEATEPGAVSGLKTAVLRMEAELGLSTVGLNSLRWKIEQPVVRDAVVTPIRAADSLSSVLDEVDGAV